METKALKAPFIPVAEHDGLIKVSDLENDLVVIFEVWFYATEHDTCQLMINGTLVGEAQAFPEPLPEMGTEITIMLKKSELEADGVYQIAYRARNVIGGQNADSPPVTIRVDRTAPGAALLAPAVIPDVISGLIPGYAGMEPGDVIEITCNDIACQSLTVMPEHMSDTLISFTLARDILGEVGAQATILQYSVTDRAGNTSRKSLATLVDPTH